MNFALIMLLLLVFTGFMWLLDITILKPRRALGAPEPWWIEYPKSFFPVILVVFVLRSFLVEPFKIPSGSMIPTLSVGDFILVNKYTYGIRLPVVNTKLIEVNHPQPGEVMVFHYPDDPSVDYIKRVVGVPGDMVQYRDKRLTINGKAIKTIDNGNFTYLDGLNLVSGARYREVLGGHAHDILTLRDYPSVQVQGVKPFESRDNCVYNEDGSGFTCTVPQGHYFMMGDNRDSSSDSRYWGFVPENNIVGRAFFIWWNWDDFSSLKFQRIGRKIN